VHAYGLRERPEGIGRVGGGEGRESIGGKSEDEPTKVEGTQPHMHTIDTDIPSSLHTRREYSSLKDCSPPLSLSLSLSLSLCKRLNGCEREGDAAREGPESYDLRKTLVLS